MNKYQPFRFLTIDDFIEAISENEYTIYIKLKKLIFETIPNCQEKLAYNVPFYYCNSRICFIWPGSIPWGVTKVGVTFGLCRGNLLHDPNKYMVLENRKEVSMRVFYSVNDLNMGVLQQLLMEALLIDSTYSAKIAGMRRRM